MVGSQKRDLSSGTDVKGQSVHLVKGIRLYHIGRMATISVLINICPMRNRLDSEEELWTNQITPCQFCLVSV